MDREVMSQLNACRRSLGETYNLLLKTARESEDGTKKQFEASARAFCDVIEDFEAMVDSTLPSTIITTNNIDSRYDFYVDLESDLVQCQMCHNEFQGIVCPECLHDTTEGNNLEI